MELLLILFFIIIILIILIVLFKINNPCINDKYEFTDFETGCKPTRYGCCNDKITTKLDPWGSNCYGS